MKKRYTLDGKNYNVDVNSQAGIKWLEKNPTAVLVGEFDESGQIKVDPTFVKSQAEPTKKKTGSTESATVEPKKKAQTTGDMDLSLEDGSLDYVDKALERYESYTVNEEQASEAERRAQEKIDQLNYITSLGPTATRQLAKKRGEEEGFFDSMATSASALLNLQTPNNQLLSEVYEEKKQAKKEKKELYDNAFEELLREENANRDPEQRIQVSDEDGNITDEYNQWVNATIESGAVDAKAKSILKKKYEDEYFDENLEKSVEDRTSWYDFTMTDSQLEEEEVAKKAIEQLNDESKKVVKSQNALVNNMSALGEKYEKYEELSFELSSIGKRLEAITSKQYTTQEDYDAAVLEYDRLKGQYDNKLKDYEANGGLSFDQLQKEQETLSSAYERVQQRSENMIQNEEDLKKYVDAVGRNYNFITNIYGQVASSFMTMGASYASFVGMVDDMIESAASNLPEQIQTEAANVMRLYSGPLSVSLLVNKGVESVSGEDTIENVEKALYGYTESISNGLEAPAEFSEIKDLKSAGEWYAHMVASQAANTAVSVSTGGASLFILGATSAGAKYHDLQEEMKAYSELPDGHPMKDFKYSKLQQYSSAIFSGAVEGLSEKITLGQLNKVKGLLSTDNVMKRGFSNFLYRNFATKKGLYNNFYDPIEEGASELASQFGSNVVDRLILNKENSLLEGLDESFVSGVLMSGTVFKAPAIGKNIVKAFQSTDVSLELDFISRRLQDKTDLLNNLELSEEVRLDTEAQIDELVKRHSTLMMETVRGYENMSKEHRAALISIDVQNAKLLKANKNLELDASLSEEQVNQERKQNNEKISEQNATKEQILAEASSSINEARISRSTRKAQRDIEKITGKPAKVIRATQENFNEAVDEFKKSEFEYYDSEIKSLEAKIESSTKETDKIKLKYELEKMKERRKETAETDYSEHSSKDGFIGGGSTILINGSAAAKLGATNVANHELLHLLLKNTLADNPQAAVVMGGAIREYLIENVDPDALEQSVFANRMRLYLKDPMAVRAEETITLFLDAIASGDLKVNSSNAGSFKSAFNNILGSAGAPKVSLSSNQDVVDFIVNFQNSRKSIFGFRRRGVAKQVLEGIDISKEMMAKASGMAEMYSRESKDANKPDSGIRMSTTSDVTATVDELGKMGWDNSTWKESGGYSFALTEMQENKMLDRLIASKLKVPMSPDDTREFVAKVYAELTSHVKNFKPDDNDSLFGWINSQISNKAGNVYNREYKATEESRGVEIDAVNEKGDPNIQIAADIDYEMNRIDDIGLDQDQKDDYSRLRRDLGLDEDMMNTVRKAVMKVFGTKLPEVDSKKFKSALEQAFRSELKKPIQDKMGGREDYDMFLVDNFSAVFNALPASTLVSMEKNVDPEQRIFTTSERITKPTEVDRLVSEGRLPKDVNRLSGPFLHTKKPVPNTRQVLAFFRGKDMKNVLGYEVGGSTLGTRKDKLAMEIGVELAFDATSEVIQMPDVRERREGIMELQGYEVLENDIAMVAKAIDRDPTIKFSMSSKIELSEVLLNGEVPINTFIESIDKLQYSGTRLSNNGKVRRMLKADMPDISKQTLEFLVKKLEKYHKAYVIGNKSRRAIDKKKFEQIASPYDYALIKVKSQLDQYDSGIVSMFEGLLPDGVRNTRELVNAANLNIARSSVIDLFAKLEDELGRDKALEMFITNTGMFTGSSIIGVGGMRLENGIIVEDSSVKGNGRFKLFEGVSDYRDALGITPGDIKKFKEKGGKTQISQKPKDFFEKNYDQKVHEENADNQREFSEMMIQHLVEDIKSNEADGIQGYNQGAVSAAIILRGTAFETNGSFRAAAKIKYTPSDMSGVNASNANEELRYEHMEPAIVKLQDAVAEIYKNGKLSENFWDDYNIALIPKSMDDAITAYGYRSSRPVMYKKGDNPLDRYYNSMTARSGKLVELTDVTTGKTVSSEYLRASNMFANKDMVGAIETLDAVGLLFSKSGNVDSKGMSTFDFDETLIIHGENFIVATKDGKELKISSGDWPLKGPALQQEGWEFDFSDFVNVRGGVEGPLLQKMRNQIEKFGNTNVFVLTARPTEAQLPIFEWLKSKGINLPIENITGLGDGRGEAKAAWMLKKYSEGYNDMYFVDDALPNVKAVKQVMDEFDIKGKSVQAIIKFSKTASEDFNDMLERVSGVRSGKTFSGYEAKVGGKGKGRFKFFVPPSAEDFKGLIYSFLGTGKQGDADLKWFEEYLFRPYSKAIKEIDSFNQTVSEDYAKIRSEFNDVTSRFKDEVPGTKLNLEQAIRVFLFAQADVKIPGMDSTTISVVREYMKNDEAASQFADMLSAVTRNKRGYVKPKQYWLSGNIASDLVINAQEARKQFLKQWITNKDLVFSESNMNKIEAVYGPNFRESLDNILWRMENGTNKYRTGDPVVNKFVNWINGSVGAVMFFNMRSAVLQTMSAVNYINWSDNNLFEAAKAFSNQKQYWSDVSTLFNSDMLKQRRSGLKIDVSASELSNAFDASNGKVEGVISWLLEKGFKPTQIADSLAISTGGATFYRNRIKKYLKDGLDKKAAEEKAFDDFMEITEENQQSSRPDLVSQQQAGPLGRMILAWQNTPMQYTRLTKKALSDLVNGRGDWKTNVSKILYYGMAQNVLFGAIQSGLMFMMFGGDDDEEELNKKSLRVANGTLDTLLRGTGVYGAAAATLKNVIMKWYEESEKGFGKKDMSKVAVEIVNLSPPIGSKVRKVMNAIKSYDYNKEVMKKMDYSFNNPGWDVLSNLVEATTNIPLARVVNKAKNIELALSATTEPWQKVALILGWNKWDIGLEDVELEEARQSVKEDKADAAKERREERKEERKAEREEQNKKEEEEKREQGIKQVQCSHVKNDGKRCKVMVETRNETALCQYHKSYNEREGSDINNDGVKEFQCTAKTSSGKQCKNRTENSNKRCYAHQ